VSRAGNRGGWWLALIAVAAVAGCHSLEGELLATDPPMDGIGRFLLGTAWGFAMPALLVGKLVRLPVVLLPADQSGAFFSGYVIGILGGLAALVPPVRWLRVPRRPVRCISCGWVGPYRRFIRRGCPRCGTG
jgi:hypothetical protein